MGLKPFHEKSHHLGDLFKTFSMNRTCKPKFVEQRYNPMGSLRDEAVYLRILIYHIPVSLILRVNESYACKYTYLVLSWILLGGWAPAY